MSAARIGVLVTYFGERELLSECLLSVLGQPEAPDEVLVYDDASDAPAQEFLPAGFDVTVIRGEANRGPSVGRNVLLRRSTADYVHFHDADDLFRPAWSRRVRRCIGDTDADVVLTEVASQRDGRPVTERVLELGLLEAGGDLTAFALRGSLLVPSGTYRRSAVLAIGGYRESLWQSEDLDFNVRLAASGVRWAAIDEPLVEIRLRAAGRSQDQKDVWACAVSAYELLADELPVRYRPELAEAAARAGGRLVRLGAAPDARRAFALAARLGPPSYRDRRKLYRVMARLLGPELAERIGMAQRSAVRWPTHRRDAP